MYRHSSGYVSLNIPMTIDNYLVYFSSLFWSSLYHFCCKSMRALPLYNTQWADKTHSLYIWAKTKDLKEFSAIIGISGEYDNNLAATWPRCNSTTKWPNFRMHTPPCDNSAGCIHLRDLICPPFGQVTIYNTLYIMFSPNQFSKGPE